MKIAQLIPYFFSGVGGLEVCVHNISTELVKLGLDVSVIHTDKPPVYFKPAYNLVRKDYLRVLPGAFWLSKTLITPYIKKIQKEHRFDVWQVNGGYPYGTLLSDLLKKNNVPSVLRCSGEDIQVDYDLNYGWRRDPKINRRIQQAYRQYDALIAITETVRTEYKMLGCQDSKIHIIPNGVSIDKFLVNRKPKNIRTKYNIPDKARIILTVGRNHPKKGYQFIPEILDTILKKGIDAYWIVIGKGTAKIKESIANKEILARIICVEELSHDPITFEIPARELIDYYKSADIFAMTSLLETFGIVLIEAMGAGLPVVCFDVPGVRDVITKEVGLICQPNDLDAFSSALASFLNQSDISVEQIKNIEYAKTFDWKIIARKYLRVYERIM